MEKTKKEFIINEDELFILLDNSKKVLLIEPQYPRQYFPIGLGKISTYIKSNGGEVKYSRSVINEKFDLICITSLFTTNSKEVIQAINQCRQNIFLNKIPIIIGGIFASLMPEYIFKETGIKTFAGISNRLDSLVPDYSLPCELNDFWDKTAPCFTTRGCPNKCSYCMVWRMEPNFYIVPEWENNIKVDKPIIIIFDNSLLSASFDHLQNVVNCLVSNNKKVLFDNGFNCREIDDENSKQLARLSYIRYGLRIGFDRIEDDGYYQTAMETLIRNGCKIKNGISMTYILYNFDDTPQEAYYRAREAWKYKSYPYLMRYRPLNSLSKNNKNVFIGKYWTKNLIKAFDSWGKLYGYNRGDKTFESWVKGYDDKHSYKMNSEDWDAWYYEKNNLTRSTIACEIGRKYGI